MEEADSLSVQGNQTLIRRLDSDVQIRAVKNQLVKTGYKYSFFSTLIKVIKLNVSEAFFR